VRTVPRGHTLNYYICKAFQSILRHSITSRRSIEDITLEVLGALARKIGRLRLHCDLEDFETDLTVCLVVDFPDYLEVLIARNGPSEALARVLTLYSLLRRRFRESEERNLEQAFPQLAKPRETEHQEKVLAIIQRYLMEREALRERKFALYRRVLDGSIRGGWRIGLRYAISIKSPFLARLLIGRGADPLEKNAQGLSSLEYAYVARDREVMWALTESLAESADADRRSRGFFFRGLIFDHEEAWNDADESFRHCLDSQATAAEGTGTMDMDLVYVTTVQLMAAWLKLGKVDECREAQRSLDRILPGRLERNVAASTVKKIRTATSVTDCVEAIIALQEHLDNIIRNRYYSAQDLKEQKEFAEFGWLIDDLLTRQ